MKNLVRISSVILIIFVYGCGPKASKELQIGKWRGVFKLQGAEVPFNFNVEDNTAGTISVLLVNAEERFKLDSVRYEGDSVIVPVEVYDAFLIAKIDGDILQGYFRKNQSRNQGIPFTATRNQTFRFEQSRTQGRIPNINGTWSVFLSGERGVRYTVGKFNQEDGRVTGTILTTTGDYRYFDGFASQDSLKLSAFSGSNPSLLVARFTDSLHLSGYFISPTGKVKLEATRSDTAKLPDPYKLTYLKKGYDKLEFSFPDLSRNQVSLGDEKYKNKVVIVTIQGSWCPNCLDEAAFLSPWYKQNRDRGIEIIGLSFERKDDFPFAKSRIEKFIKRFDIQYDVLFAGSSDKAKASEKLPALNAVLSYPTTIILDRSGQVYKIHTGFSGPATGELYQEFINDFNKDVEAALAINETVKI